MKKLTESEELVMKSIWDCKKEPVLGDIVEHVTTVYGKDWKPQTVSTFLAKLCGKQYLQLQRSGKMYTYKILVKESDYIHDQLKQICVFWYQGNVDALKADVEKI